jgi:transposase InsO family protein
MRLEGLRGRAAQRFRYIATRHREMPAAPNRVGQDFATPALNRLWLADITQVRTREGWLFLAVLLDACSRRIVGWATASRPV